MFGLVFRRPGRRGEAGTGYTEKAAGKRKNSVDYATICIYGHHFFQFFRHTLSFEPIPLLGRDFFHRSRSPSQATANAAKATPAASK